MHYWHERKKGFKLKLSFIIFIIVFFSVAATFTLNTLVSFNTQKSSLTNNTLDMNLITAGEISQTTNTILLSMQDSLEAAAEFISDGGSGNQKSAQHQVDFLRASVPYFNSVVLVDSSGTVTAASPEELDIKGSRLTSVQSREALAEKRPLVSDPYMSLTKHMIVLASYPVYSSDGLYMGFVGGTIYLQESNVFQKLLGQQRVNENGSYFYVVDADGNLIFHPEAARIGENVSGNPAVKELLSGRSGKMELTNTLGTSYLAGYSVVPATGWGIIFQTPTENVGDSVDNVISRMALISVPLLVLLLLLALFVSHRLASPINRLASAASRLKRGDATVRELPEARSMIFEAKVLYDTVSAALRTLDERAEVYSRQARTDVLTGLRNRRRMEAIVEDWASQRVPFSVIMIDIDHFKQVNDTFGHQNGDETLRYVAGILVEEKGSMDQCCRYGGEEFAILLPWRSAEQAFELAERIRIRTENGNSPTGQVLTVSLGISEFPAFASDAKALFKQADEALYAAKDGGRNRAVIHRPGKNDALK
ncbi:sensor domain-containing diguanylate cyclase [Cohnella lubricantis]|uniref:Diguanylate cyclase n=1 Tax=Cohnella lubricantis TaxID=2163172 RepID=A0A841TFB4_9BACL|nr:sensor domain-containing diguanylate cyclase [Cohnella lubricantis]MBB6679006.1 diguanylate cyclase [Cohnella lubricantis]MBP2119506.1 diguanylate cyclase (GGDEF)-like protein [Cohnella lubricantis]